MADDVVATVMIEAPPEAVFEFLVDAEKLTRWMGTSATIDPEPGGEFRLNVTGDDVAVGAYTVVDAPHRVAFTWGWDGNDGVPPGSSTVTIDLTPVEDRTEVRLTHSGLPDADAVASHGEGWTHYLARLTEVGEGRAPGPDPWAQQASSAG